MYNQNEYDIIIENILKDIESMDKNTKEKWEIPLYSGNQINKAGKIISDSNSTPKEREKALKIVNNWRASHAYPLQIICSHLRRNNPNAIVVQRLKRLESITDKLERNHVHTMQLYRMQDLGGCRVIVNSIDEVYKAIDKYKKSRVRHILKKEYDYIQSPKVSGYRSYHMVYKYHSDTKDTYNQNMLIEIQFRTKLQHIWATAVEMMVIYNKSNQKASQGNKDILRFFTLVSSVFAIQEDMPVCPNTSEWIDELIMEIESLDKKHNILSTLSAINVSIDHTDKYTLSSKNLYYILILNYDKKTVSIIKTTFSKPAFTASKIEAATKAYNQIEQKTNNNVVLVSASSFEALKLAYPNYFVDISDFIDKLRSYIDTCKKYKE